LRSTQALNAKDAACLLCGYRGAPNDVSLAFIANLLITSDATSANISRIYREHFLGNVCHGPLWRTRNANALTVGLALNQVFGIARGCHVENGQLRVDGTREQIATDAFALLEIELGDLATMLVIGLGDRTRAMRWMCTRHRELGGRNPYQVLADGDRGQLWDAVERLFGE
jgi:hypothetical protein